MRKTIDKIRSMKSEEKITVLTAYDYQTAKNMDGLIDIVLVGDSLGMVVYGYHNTLDVTLDDMRRHVFAVSRGIKESLVVGDLPVGTYDNTEEALANSKRLIEAGADCVKIENKHEIAKALTKEGIGVMGHVGLTPQTITDFKVQGKETEAAQKIISEAKALEEAGCFAIVIECVPKELAKKITSILSIPTIGIGAGVGCDGQVIVVNDLLGMDKDFKPKFVKKYENFSTKMKEAFTKYSKEVKEKRFPSEEYSFK